MGNENSINFINAQDYGSVLLSLDKKIYEPGDFVSGKIYMKIEQTFPDNEIKFLIQGYEEILYYHRFNDFELQKCYENNIIYNDLYVVKSYQKNIEKGDYVIPFKFQLRMGLSPSYSYNYIDDGEKAYSRIKYVCIAGISKDNKKNTSLVSKKLELYIDSNISTQNQDLRNTLSKTGFCKRIISCKGNFRIFDLNKNEVFFVYGGQSYNFKFNITNLKPKNIIQFIKFNIVMRVQVDTKKYLSDLKEKTLFEYCFSNFDRVKDSLVSFNIPMQIFDPKIITIDTPNIKHRYYLVVNVVNESKKIDESMRFPIIVKNGFCHSVKTHDKFIYNSGGINEFVSDFYPESEFNNEIDLSLITPIQNHSLLTNFESKSILNNEVIKKNN